MRPSSTRKIENIRCLLAMLGPGGMAIGAIAESLRVSPRGVRNYLDQLEAAGVGHYDPGRRGYFALNEDEVALRQFLRELHDDAMPVAFQLRPSPHGTGPGARDPLVAALFGQRG